MTARHAAPKRRKKEYEDDEFAKAAGRMINALGRRAATNPEALAFMLEMKGILSKETDRAAASLHADAGFSLGEIAKFLTEFGHPMSRQNAVKRWGPAAVARKFAPAQIANVINLAKFRAKKASTVVWGEDVEINRRDAI